MATLLESYSESNYESVVAIGAVHPTEAAANSACGQVFTCPAGGPYILTSAKLYLAKGGSPNATYKFAIYATSGTTGTDAVPTGSELGSTATANASALGTSPALKELAFSNPVTIYSGASYWIGLVVTAATTIDASNKILVGRDSTSPSHAGNLARYVSGAWLAVSTLDTCFYIYGNKSSGGAFLLNFV